MDCSFVFSVFFIVLLLNAGFQVNGQILTLCEDPLLSTRCTLKCSRGAANESVVLYKRNAVEIECGNDNICSKSTEIYTDSSNPDFVKFNILRLGYADGGDWKCKSGGRTGESKELQVYSFKPGNVEMDIRSIGNKRHNLTVKIECVMPGPEIVVRFFGIQLCRGEGSVYFNGPCANKNIENHRKFNCILDLNFMQPKYHGKESTEPIQLAVYLYGREVYSTESSEVFAYEKGKEDFRKGKEEFQKGKEDFRKEKEEFQKGKEDFRKEKEEFQKGKEDFRKEKEEFQNHTGGISIPNRVLKKEEKKEEKKDVMKIVLIMLLGLLLMIGNFFYAVASYYQFKRCVNCKGQGLERREGKEKIPLLSNPKGKCDADDTGC